MCLKEVVKQYFPKENVDNVLKAIESDNPAIKYNPRKIAKHMGNKLLGSNEFLPITKDIFNSLFSLADFSSDEESLCVADIFYRGMTMKDYIPRIIDYFNDLYINKGHEFFASKELAEKCLISTSLHYDSLVHRCERKNAPHPDFYISWGSMLFHNMGKKEISNNFENWRQYARDIFIGD